MSRPAPPDAAKPASDLLEEAVALLRQAPAGLFLAYYTGAIPFWLALLFFTSDMSRDAYAAAQLAESSLQVALAYLWMKCWHAYFCSELGGPLRAGAVGREKWSLRRVADLVAAQALWQPFGLAVRFVALCLTLPYVWVASFYQNVTVLGDGGPAGERSLFRRSWEGAQKWPGQAHSLAAKLWLFALFIWLNVFTSLALAPILLKTFLGIETAATRASDSYLYNSTLWLSSFAITALFFDPLIKAVYVLRCFYFESLASGADLRMRLAWIGKQARQQGALLVLAALFLVLSPAGRGAEGRAASGNPEARPARVETLNHSIDETLSKREFAWRAPRADAAPAERPSWLKSIIHWIKSILEAAARGVKSFIDWLKSLFSDPDIKNAPDPGGKGSLLELIVIVLAVVILGLLVWLLIKMRRQPRGEALQAVALPARPDLEAPDVAADQLPEDEWLEFARELAAKGEFRLALRAGYLACLAHLGQRELLTIAKYKSNREYDRELKRRARSREGITAAFGRSLQAFECVWYGEHQASAESVADLRENLEKMRAC